ncbi:hypothetical protein FRC19_000658 [Serendipita sp. 401]|nr:hypothetical protein FRC19_000658 [Serendipita sp. 401]
MAASTMGYLFEFPTMGSALTALKGKSINDDSELPPPRKVARHGSASSPHKHRTTATGRTGLNPIEIKLRTPAQAPDFAAMHTLVYKFIRTFLQTGKGGYSGCLGDIHEACKVLVLEANQGDALEGVLTTSLRLCCENILREFKSSDASVNDFLEKFLNWWSWWHRRLDTLRAVLLFLDIVHLESHENKSSIREAGFQRFKDTVLLSSYTMRNIEEALKAWSNDKRMGVLTVDEPRLKKLVRCTEDLGCYEPCIEEPYLSRTTEFYAKESAKATSKTAVEYLQLCAKSYEQEKEIEMGDFRPETSAASSLIALQQLVIPHIDLLAKEALADIIATRDHKYFVELHNMLTRVTSSSKSWTASPSDTLLSHYRNDIISRVKDIVTDTEHDATMVDNLLELKEFLDTCLSKEFLDDVEQSDRQYTHATSEAFEKGFACRRIKPAEMIARKIDSLMREGQKSSSDGEFFVKMTRILTLYRFSPDKDAFRTFYKRALTKRLLLGRSASDDFEKQVLEVLSKSYDAAFSDMTQMFKDLVVSKDLLDDYRHPKRNEPERPDLNLSVMVLQHSMWPVAKKVSKPNTGVEIRLPSKMEEALNDYADFYRTRHGNRRLTWAHYLGTATLRAYFPAGKKELSVSLYQATVLLLFNERDEWSTEEIEDRTSLGTSDLVPTIQSLALGKQQLLRRTDARIGKNVKRDDRFSFNEEFTDTKVKIRVNTIQQNDTVEEIQQAVKVIDQHRDASLEAAIVRVMKAAKTMKHQQLVNETIDAVSKHFRPDVNAIKSRIESLIEREFIARKDGNTNVYSYLA